MPTSTYPIGPVYSRLLVALYILTFLVYTITHFVAKNHLASFKNPPIRYLGIISIMYIIQGLVFGYGIGSLPYYFSILFLLNFYYVAFFCNWNISKTYLPITIFMTCLAGNEIGQGRLIVSLLAIPTIGILVAMEYTRMMQIESGIKRRYENKVFEIRAVTSVMRAERFKLEMKERELITREREIAEREQLLKDYLKGEAITIVHNKKT